MWILLIILGIKLKMDLSFWGLLFLMWIIEIIIINPIKFLFYKGFTEKNN